MRRREYIDKRSTNDESNQIAAKTTPEAGVRRFDLTRRRGWLFTDRWAICWMNMWVWNNNRTTSDESNQIAPLRRRPSGRSAGRFDLMRKWGRLFNTMLFGMSYDHVSLCMILFCCWLTNIFVLIYFLLLWIMFYLILIRNKMLLFCFVMFVNAAFVLFFILTYNRKIITNQTCFQYETCFHPNLKLT